METVLIITQIASMITTGTAALLIFVRPIREKLFKEKKEDLSEREGLKCLLRNEILKIYYKNRDKQEIEEYEAQNFMHLYDSYVALGGNSFILEIYNHVTQWKVIK